MLQPHPLSVLLADDDPDDRMLFADAILELNRNLSLTCIDNGEELIHYLLNSASILPDILFLDLNMPRKNGFQCLEEIRSHQELSGIFIVIYSTTGSPREIDEVFEKGANLFLNKPNSYTGLKNTLSKVFDLDHTDRSWFTKARFVFTQAEHWEYTFSVIKLTGHIFLYLFTPWKTCAKQILQLTLCTFCM